MKQCPQCNRTYADETLTFCLADGALLSAPYDSAATLILPSSSGLPFVTEPSPHKQSKPQVALHNRRFNLSHIVILVLVILLAGSAVALFYEKGKESTNSNATSTPATLTPNPIKPEQNAITPTSSNAQDTSASPPVIKNQARFSVSSCNSIKDSQTGLEWYVGPDRNITWYEAQQWTGGLNTCGGGWRMPSIEEIRTLYNPYLKAGTGFYLDGKYFPAHIDPVFNAIGGGSWVWSNEKLGEDNARSFNLNQGKAVAYAPMNTHYSTRAFAVRSIRN